jgi:hypothetical protein
MHGCCNATQPAPGEPQMAPRERCKQTCDGSVTQHSLLPLRTEWCNVRELAVTNALSE